MTNPYLITPVVKPHNTIDELIISLMAKGYNVQGVAQELKRQGHKPCSQSSVEKALKALRNQHQANTNFHLAVILIRKGYKLK